MNQTVTRFGCVGFQCMRAGFLFPKCDNFACLHTRQDQNELHLKRGFFAKISIFCKSIDFSVVQAYTQPYLFGGRIKLIIYQIRHKLSVTIYEISTSCPKKPYMANSIYKVFWCKNHKLLTIRFCSDYYLHLVLKSNQHFIYFISSFILKLQKQLRYPLKFQRQTPLSILKCDD